MDGKPTCPLIIREGQASSVEYGGTASADGHYFLGLQRFGAAVKQAIPKHNPGGTYKLKFYLAKSNLGMEDPVLRVTVGSQFTADFTVTSQTMSMGSVDYFPNNPVMNIKFENVSPDRYNTVYIDYIHIQEGLNIPARCSDIMYYGNVWGEPGIGINVAAYTTGHLKWIGCTDNGCADSTFYCTDVAGVGMNFGTTDNKALRALLGTTIPTSGSTCASATDTDGVANAMDEQSSTEKLCQQLGYATGVLTANTDENSCPEVHYDFVNNIWTSDFVPSKGYGQSFECHEVSTTSTMTSTTRR